MGPLTVRNSWRRELATRLAAHVWLKIFGIGVFIGIFFAAYFGLLRHPIFEVTMMPVTWLDREIPAQPEALGLYFSLWIYVALVPALLRTRSELFAHAKIGGAMALGGLGCFLFFPTAVPALDALADESSLSWLKQVDAAGNACPSLHVAFAVFSGLWLHRVLVEMRVSAIFQWLNLIWCVAIAYSTLATKQHVVVDVVLGGLLGWVAGRVQAQVQAEERLPVVIAK